MPPRRSRSTSSRCKPVLKPADAVKPGAPLVFDQVANNIALDFHYGDAEKVADAFAKAKHVTRLETSNQRMVVNAMEPRAAIGEFDAASGKWTLYSCSQGVHRLEDVADGCSRRAGRQGARHHRPGRRLVRHEGLGLSGICLHPARRPRARPAGEMDRRALGQLRVRSSRPRAGHDDRDRLRREPRIFWRSGSQATATWAAISPSSGRCCRPATR